MTGRTARSPGSWLWIALATCGTACGGNVTSGSGEDGPPGPGETPDDPLPTRAFEVEAGPRDPDDPDDLQAFTVPPGEEEWICVTTRLVNQERVQARRVSVEPGAGVARVEVNAIYDDPRTGLDPCEEHVPYVPLHADGLPGFDPDAPENSGLAFELPPHATVALWVHALNVTDRDVIAHAKVRIEELREPATHILRPLFWNATAPDVRGETCAVKSRSRGAASARSSPSDASRPSPCTHTTPTPCLPG